LHSDKDVFEDKYRSYEQQQFSAYYLVYFFAVLFGVNLYSILCSVYCLDQYEGSIWCSPALVYIGHFFARVHGLGARAKK